MFRALWWDKQSEDSQQTSDFSMGIRYFPSVFRNVEFQFRHFVCGLTDICVSSDGLETHSDSQKPLTIY